jgi:hypothetical protein
MATEDRSAASSRRKPKRARQLGVTDDEYAGMLAEQGGVCAICGGTPKRLKKDGTPYRMHVDHDHTTGRVRGLLCFQCNRLLLIRGMTAERLLNAARYLQAWKRIHARAATEGDTDAP